MLFLIVKRSLCDLRQVWDRYHIVVVLIHWFTHALFDKDNNKIHERLKITDNKKVTPFYWVLFVTVSS